MAQPRFVLVDAMRGIAAGAVLCHHLLFNSALQITLWGILPLWFAEFCHFGAFGVEIFFVLSGFVIAHSLRNLPLNMKTVGNFMFRRQLRLDPPYWAMIAITLVSLIVEAHFPWIDKKPFPTWLDILKNLFYLQKLTDGMFILGVSWTLCLEVQFYILLIFLLISGKWLSPSGKRAADFSFGLVAAVAAVSLVIQRGTTMPGDTIEGWFIEWWFYFAAGALGYWAVQNPRYRLPFLGFMASFLLAAILEQPRPMIIGWSAAMLLYTAGRMGTLTTWLNFRVLQYLGKISYSLYLSHLLVAVYVLRFGYRLTKTNPVAAVGWFILAGIISIIFAHLLYLAVERTSIRFSSRFKLKPMDRDDIDRSPDPVMPPPPSSPVDDFQQALHCAAVDPAQARSITGNVKY